MPPVDIFRMRVSGYEHVEPQAVAIMVEEIVMRATTNNAASTAIATTRTTAMVIRKMGGDLVPSTARGTRKIKHRHRRHRHRHFHSRGRHYSGSHRHRHHRPCHGRPHHYHHRHRHSKNPEKGPVPAPDQPPKNHVGHAYAYHAVPHVFRYQHQQIQSGSRLADFALGELGFLALSFVLSMVLLLVGYKIGECVYKFENSRNRTRGCGHRNSLARRHACRGTQTSHYGSSEKQTDRHPPPQPIYLEEDVTSNQDAVDSSTMPVTAPDAARTKGRGI